MQAAPQVRKTSLTSAIAVILALAIAAGSLFYSFTGTHNVTTTSTQVLTNTINNTVTSVSTATATSVSTAYSTVTSTATSILTSTSTTTSVLTSTATVTTTLQPTFNTVSVLFNSTVNINGSGYNSYCNCNTPGLWVWNSITYLSHLGYLKISVLPNISDIYLYYAVNGTTYSTSWCFSKSFFNCSYGPPQVTLAVLPGTIIKEIDLLNYSPSPVTVTVEVSYQY